MGGTLSGQKTAEQLVDMAKLLIHQSDGGTREVLLDRDRMTIGRRPDHDICLPFPAVSADHAEIVTVIADSFLHDLGSTNGTLVNGERVNKHFLKDHDRIDIGRQCLVYLTNEAEALGQRVSPESTDQTAEGSVLKSVLSVAQAADRTTEQPNAGSLSSVDDLLTNLLETHMEASAAIDIPPPVAGGPSSHRLLATERSAASYAEHATVGAYIEVMSGPNAGQITPIMKSEFVFGKAGEKLARIRQDDEGFHLIPAWGRDVVVNDRKVEPLGKLLAFGDSINIAGVRLRFERRNPV
jgi:pSer/pThr/pTyr-binding forkhead associated (FHA) protein